MQQIVILGGGAAGLAAALAAAQSAPAGAVRVTVLDRNPRCGKKLLATGNGRCNLDNTGIAPEQYFTADSAALRPLLVAVDAAAPLEWFAALGLYTRTDEAGRVYPYSNQAADVLALLEGHLARLGVEVRTGCTVQTLSQNRSGYTILCENAEGQDQTLRADAVICAMGGNAGPQFGTDGFGTRFAAQCGGKLEPLYPCLTALQTAKPNRSLAGIRAKAAATLLDLDRHCTVAVESGEVQFTDYGLSGICIMQLSGHLAPGRGPKRPAVELDLFPMLDETALTADKRANKKIYAEAFLKNAKHAADSTAALRKELADTCTLVDDPAQADFALLFVSPSSGEYFNATPGYLELDICEDKTVCNVDESGKPTTETHKETTLVGANRLAGIAAAVHAHGGKVVSNINCPLAWEVGNVEKVSDALTVGFDTYPSATLDVMFGRFAPVGKLPLTLPKGDEVLAVNADGVCISPNDVPGFAKDAYMPDSMKDENGKAYAYRDAAGNYYEMNFGLTF